MTTLPTDYAALSEMLRDHLGAEQQVVVPALMAIVRLVSERKGLDLADAPEAITQALATLEAWCRGGVEYDALWNANLALEQLIGSGGERLRKSAWDDVLTLVICTLRVALHEDHMDWPEEVGGWAIKSLCRLGDDEARATQAVAAVFQRHGLL